MGFLEPNPDTHINHQIIYITNICISVYPNKVLFVSVLLYRCVHMGIHTYMYASMQLCKVRSQQLCFP